MNILIPDFHQLITLAKQIQDNNTTYYIFNQSNLYLTLFTVCFVSLQANKIPKIRLRGGREIVLNHNCEKKCTQMKMIAMYSVTSKKCEFINKRCKRLNLCWFIQNIWARLLKPNCLKCVYAYHTEHKSCYIHLLIKI